MSDNIHVLGEFFLSEVLTQRIRDAKGQTVGRVRDMAVRWDRSKPVVTGIKYAKDVQRHIDVNQIASWDKKGLVLYGSLEEAAVRTLTDEEIYVGKWLLDKQIIDLKGAKLVRVNDIKLAWIEYEGVRSLVLVAVDVGFRGLMRRLKLERFFRSWPERLLGMEAIHPLEARTSNLRLMEDYRKLLEEGHPADIADIVEDLDPRERKEFLENVDDEKAAEVLSEVDLDTKIEIIRGMDKQRASDILEEMPGDEAADILGELSPEKSNELLNLMEPQEADGVRRLMEYEEDTAGAIMTDEYIALSPAMTAASALAHLRENAMDVEMIYYLYILDEAGKLIGVLSLRELIVADPDAPIKDLMEENVITVTPDDDEYKVFATVSKYGLLAVPVVDNQGKMLGIITVDDVVDRLTKSRAGAATFARFEGVRKLARRLPR